MSSFSKNVMIAVGKLNQMHQSQIRNYSPELHSLAELQNQMIEIICNRTLSSDQKQNLLSNYKGRFDKLKKETGVLVGATTKPDAPANQPEPVKQLIITQHNDEKPVHLIENMGIIPMYRNKAIKLLSKIKQNPNILTYKKDGQEIIKGEPITRTYL